VIKAIIQLAIVALLLNAAYQAVRSYYTFYDFQASLTEEAQKPRTTKMSQLHQRTIDLGAEYGIDIEWNAVQVRQEEGRTLVDFSYVDPVPFVPKYYVRPWEWQGSVSTLRARPLEADERY
jgi:hypothetical protein